MNQIQLPKIDVVIIGLNAEKTLAACVKSVAEADYPKELLNIIYVDTGSSDRTLELASNLPRLEVIKYDGNEPSPGLGRNLGWRYGNAPLVQFLDSDTIMNASWLKRAYGVLSSSIVAVHGRREEVNPEASVFNYISNLEWNPKPGESLAFGGDVLIKRSVLEETGGYNESLVGGEDPELSSRIRAAGKTIQHIDQPMTLHDINMKRPRQYWKRAYRTGYGYGAMFDTDCRKKQGSWNKEILRIVIRGLVAPVVCAGGIIASITVNPLFVLPALMMLPVILYPRVFSVRRFAEQLSLSRRQACQYAWHCSFVVIPEGLGLMRYLIGQCFNCPLSNRASGLVVACLSALALFQGGCVSPSPGNYPVETQKSGELGEGFKDLSDKIAEASSMKTKTIKEDKLLATKEEIESFSKGVSDDYLIGPADVVSIYVQGRSQLDSMNLVVSPDGKISQQRVGIINVKGMTLEELTHTIVEKLSFYYEGPDVTVQIKEYNNNKVFVLGRVTKPGRVNLTGDGTLLEAIAQAGSTPTSANGASLSRANIIRGNGTIIWVDLRKILEDGMLAFNPKLRNNDIIFIPESDDRLAYVMGEVATPGTIKLKSQFTALDAVMSSGGPTEDAKLHYVYLIRYRDGEGHVQQISLKEMIEKGDLSKNYVLEDGDIVYVSTKLMEEIGYIIRKISPSTFFLQFTPFFME